MFTSGQHRTHHKIVTAGGGSAGISVAARLHRAGETDVAIVGLATTRRVPPTGSRPSRWPTRTTAGYVQVDKPTMQHTRYPEVFALGDAGSTPNSKTGVAIRKQAPVVVEKLRAVMAGKTPTASYGGYASRPRTTARNKMLLAEFDCTLEPTPSIPFIDTTKERKGKCLLKKHGLPALYWNLMLTGRA